MGRTVLALACCVATALRGALAADVADLRWLKGCWVSEAANGQQTMEVWMAPAGGSMLGMSRTVADGKTREFEFMRIAREEGGDIFFIAKPSGQKETRFKLIKANDREVIFENPTHDFPQRVIYRLGEGGSLVGRIEGVSHGQEKSVDFPMKRVPCDD